MIWGAVGQVQADVDVAGVVVVVVVVGGMVVVVVGGDVVVGETVVGATVVVAGAVTGGEVIAGGFESPVAAAEWPELETANATPQRSRNSAATPEMIGSGFLAKP